VTGPAAGTALTGKAGREVRRGAASVVRVWVTGRWWRELAFVVGGAVVRLPTFALL